jgi:hypothetical protein
VVIDASTPTALEGKGLLALNDCKGFAQLDFSAQVWRRKIEGVLEGCTIGTSIHNVHLPGEYVMLNTVVLRCNCVCTS